MQTTLTRPAALERAYSQGRAARILGQPALSNPFSPTREDDLYLEWSRGWNAEDRALRTGEL